MARTKEDIRKFLIEELSKVCDNVETIFVHPEAKSELNGNFPYITILFQNADIEQNSKMAMQKLSIIGFVKSDDDTISDKIDDLESKILNAIYRKSGVIITSIDNSNIFKPFGLDMGVYPPFGAVRFELQVARTLMT